MNIPMGNLVHKAISLALRAHEGQEDKGGAAYILHPLRVALRFTDPRFQIVAILHDVIEDTSTTAEDLCAAGFDAMLVEAIVALSKRVGETYDQFIARIANNDLARQVKIADLEDNMNITRLPYLTELDIARLNKYKRSHAYLTAIGDASPGSSR